MRRQAFRQSGRGQSRAPATSRLLMSFFQRRPFLLDLRRGLLGRLALRLQREQFFELGQILFGGLQSERQCTACLRQRAIECFSLLGGFLRL